uniref:Thioredoxin domain-containing protein n=1 Tax=Panagrolaimus sp. ES5 TaxID=591445 RepID=A0AC34H002_9BILA
MLFLDRFGIILIISVFVAVFSQCPYKHSNSQLIGNDEEEDANPPGLKPEAHFIQTTFIHRDKSDDDFKFTQITIDLINTLRQRLKVQTKVTIDNENIDCEDGGFVTCKEYPLNEAYHFFIVEDPTNGAAVYSLDRQHNTSPEKIELALLDALSRHSKHSLMPYASEKCEHEVGFVRELTPKDLAKFIRENQKTSANIAKASPSSIYTRSPTELNLINEQILEMRVLEEPKIEADAALKIFSGDELNNALENEEKYVFVLFWTRVNSPSLHSLHLWKQAAENLSKNENVLLGSVGCHDEGDVCRAFGITHHDKHTIFAYKNGQKLTAQYNMRDAEFYVEWVRMVAAGSMLKAEDEEKLKDARKGFLDGFLDMGQRKAVTIGIFQSEDSKEFKSFNKIATILYGRYHFVYSIKSMAPPSLTTFRPYEKMRRLDYNGDFDIPSLVRHITQGSNPTVLNLSQGFTSDIVYHSPKDLILLIHNEDRDRKTEFFDLAAKKENSIHYNFGHIDRHLDKFFNAIELNSDAVPLLCLFTSKEARCLKNVKKITQKIFENGFENAEKEEEAEAIIIELSHKKPHPLKTLQLEHINSIFGEQDIELLPDPIIAKLPQNYGHQNVHSWDFAGDKQSAGGAAAAGGCPMMAHLNPQLKDEL